MSDYEEKSSLYSALSKKGNRFIVWNERNKTFYSFLTLRDYVSYSYRNPYCHEVVTSKFTRLFFDIEWSVDADKYRNIFDDLVHRVLSIVRRMFNNELVVDEDNISLLAPFHVYVESSGKTKDGYKYSCNLIYQDCKVNRENLKMIGEYVYNEFISKKKPDCMLDADFKTFIDRGMFSKCKFNNRMVYNTKFGQDRYKVIQGGFSRGDLYGKHGCSEITPLIEPCLIGLSNFIRFSHFSELRWRYRIRGVKSVNVVFDADIQAELDLNRGGWMDNFIAHKINGSFMTFKRLRPSYCSLCARTHTADNTFYMCIKPDIFIYGCSRIAGKFFECVPRSGCEEYSKPVIPYVEMYNIKGDITNLDGLFEDTEYNGQVIDYGLWIEEKQPRKFYVDTYADTPQIIGFIMENYNSKYMVYKDGRMNRIVFNFNVTGYVDYIKILDNIEECLGIKVIKPDKDYLYKVTKTMILQAENPYNLYILQDVTCEPVILTKPPSNPVFEIPEFLKSYTHQKNHNQRGERYIKVPFEGKCPVCRKKLGRCSIVYIRDNKLVCHC